MIVPWQRARIILALSLPIALMLLAQNLMSLITIAMVSHLGDGAVAGVGIASGLFLMLMALLFGIDTGVQALVARRVGAGQMSLAGGVLNDAQAIAVVAGFLLTLLGYVAGPGLFALVTADPAVAARGLPYLYATLPMLPFVGVSFAFSAYRNATSKPHYSLLVSAIQLSCTACFGYLLIFGSFGMPRLETAGAGLGTTLAALVAFLLHGLLALRIAPIPGFLRTRPSWPGISLILKIGLPVGLQQSLVYLGITVSFGIIGLIGSGEVAAMNVVLTTMLLSILPASGMGIAAATLVAAALGRGDASDAARWGWEVARLGAVGILAFSVIFVVAPRGTLSLFIADQTTIALAATPLSIMALGMSVDAFGRILGFALRGAGATLLVTTVAFVLQWGVQLPLSWLVGVHLGFGLPGIATSRLLLFAAEAVIVTMIWRHGFWARHCPSPPVEDDRGACP